MSAKGSVRALADEITAEAQAEADKIVEEAKKEAEKIVTEKKKELESFLAEAKASAESEAERIKKTEISKAKGELKNLRVARIREIIDQAAEEALQKLRKASPKEKKETAKRLFSIAKSQMPVAVVYGKKEIASAIPDTVKFVEKDIDGIVAATSDGSVTLDLTYDTLVESIKNEQTEELIKALRGN